VPTVDLPRSADAIVSLEGDRPRRLRRAVELAAQGVAPTLVVVRGEAVAPELLNSYQIPRARLIFRRSLMYEPALVSAGCRRRRLPIDLGWEAAKFILACTLRRDP
jgi:hypothetical protein